jgi:hypothetical protein
MRDKRRPECHRASQSKMKKRGDSPWVFVSDRTDGFNGRDWNEDGDSLGEFNLDLVLGSLGGLDTHECA